MWHPRSGCSPKVPIRIVGIRGVLPCHCSFSGRINPSNVLATFTSRKQKQRCVSKQKLRNHQRFEFLVDCIPHGYTVSKNYWTKITTWGRKLEIDICVKNLEGKEILFIEFDGKQHFEVCNFHGKKKWDLSPEEEKQSQEKLVFNNIRDKAKEDHCRATGVTLLRLGYPLYTNIPALKSLLQEELRVILPRIHWKKRILHQFLGLPVGGVALREAPGLKEPQVRCYPEELYSTRDARVEEVREAASIEVEDYIDKWKDSLTGREKYKEKQYKLDLILDKEKLQYGIDFLSIFGWSTFTTEDGDLCVTDYEKRALCTPDNLKMAFQLLYKIVVDGNIYPLQQRENRKQKIQKEMLMWETRGFFPSNLLQRFNQKILVKACNHVVRVDDPPQQKKSHRKRRCEDKIFLMVEKRSPNKPEEKVTESE